MATPRVPKATRCEVFAEEYRHFVGNCGFTYHEFCDQMARVYHLSAHTIIGYLYDLGICPHKGVKPGADSKGRQHDPKPR